MNRLYISPSAHWFDVKFLICKSVGCDMKKFYVDRFDWGDDAGWLISFRNPDYCIVVKDRLGNAIQVANKVVWIGVKHG